jgi:hypothetical protein
LIPQVPGWATVTGINLIRARGAAALACNARPSPPHSCDHHAANYDLVSPPVLHRRRRASGRLENHRPLAIGRAARSALISPRTWEHRGRFAWGCRSFRFLPPPHRIMPLYLVQEWHRRLGASSQESRRCGSEMIEAECEWGRPRRGGVRRRPLRPLWKSLEVATDMIQRGADGVVAMNVE